ncbi:MAG: Hpt domain-containing protein [Gemmataceae bacterium]|nr:Hpt domain-containing protein [Gemmataceae bacterium]MDW8263837.1 Hpt domain-containing protein [Gemmataceae bacterium]
MHTVDRQLNNLRQLGGDDLLREVVGLFLSTMPARLEAARMAAQARNWGELANALHSLRSAAGNLGALAVQQSAQQLEDLIHAGRVAEVASLLEQLERGLTEVLAYLRTQAGGGTCR